MSESGKEMESVGKRWREMERGGEKGSEREREIGREK